MQQEINKMIHICERLVALAVTPEQRAKAKANLYHNIKNKPASPPPFASTHNLPFEVAEGNGGLMFQIFSIHPAAINADIKDEEAEYGSLMHSYSQVSRESIALSKKVAMLERFMQQAFEKARADKAKADDPGLPF